MNYVMTNNLEYTVKEDKSWKRKFYTINEHPHRVEQFEAKVNDESDDLQGEGLKIIIHPSSLMYVLD